MMSAAGATSAITVYCYLLSASSSSAAAALSSSFVPLVAPPLLLLLMMMINVMTIMIMVAVVMMMLMTMVMMMHDDGDDDDAQTCYDLPWPNTHSCFTLSLSPLIATTKADDCVATDGPDLQGAHRQPWHLRG